MFLMPLFKVFGNFYQDVTSHFILAGVDWQSSIIILNFVYLLLSLYVSYRQHVALSLTSITKILGNVVNAEEFVHRQKNARLRLVFDVLNQTYRFIVWRFLITFRVLPMLWIAKEDLLQGIASGPNAYASTSLMREITILSCFLFGSVSVIWFVLNLPLSYFENCVLEGLQEKKLSTRRWVLRVLLKQSFSLIAAFTCIAMCQYIFNGYAYERFYAGVFTGWLVVIGTVSIATLIVAYLIPFKNLGFAPSPKGEEQTEIEILARRVGFPLRGVHITENRYLKHFQIDVLILSLPWKRNLVLSRRILSGENVEYVVPLVVHAIGGWTYMPEYHVFLEISANLLKTMPVLLICANWLPVCWSFGFNEASTHWPEHPVMIVILLLSGALRPATQLVDMMVHSINCTFLRKADEFTEQHGYGLQFARAVIQAARDEGVDAFDGDWLYSIVFGNGMPYLSTRLEALGWVDDEELQQLRVAQD